MLVSWEKDASRRFQFKEVEGSEEIIEADKWDSCVLKRLALSYNAATIDNNSVLTTFLRQTWSGQRQPIKLQIKAEC